VSADTGLGCAVAVRTTETEVTDASAWVAVGVSGDGDEGAAVTLLHVVSSNGTTLGVVVAEETVLHVVFADVVVGSITTVVAESIDRTTDKLTVIDAIAGKSYRFHTGIESGVSPCNMSGSHRTEGGNHDFIEVSSTESRTHAVTVIEVAAVALRFTIAPGIDVVVVHDAAALFHLSDQSPATAEGGGVAEDLEGVVLVGVDPVFARAGDVFRGLELFAAVARCSLGGTVAVVDDDRCSVTNVKADGVEVLGV